MRNTIISAASGVGMALGGFAMPIVFPEVEPWVAEYMLWAAGAFLLLAMGLWLDGLIRPSADREKINIQNSDPETMKRVPATLRAAFDRDFDHTLRQQMDQLLTDKRNQNSATVTIKIHFDYHAQCSFISIYVPPSEITLSVLIDLPKLLNRIVTNMKADVKTEGGVAGAANRVGSDDLKLTGRVYIYHVDYIGLADLSRVESYWKDMGMTPIFRDTSYPSLAYPNGLPIDSSFTQNHSGSGNNNMNFGG